MVVFIYEVFSYYEDSVIMKMIEFKDVLQLYENDYMDVLFSG